jgi:hypothetical protein
MKAVWISFAVIVVGTGLAWADPLAPGPVDAITSASYRLPPFPPMTSKEAEATVSEWLQQNWMLALATVSSNGQPHVAPVSYIAEGTTVYIRSLKDTNKIQNLQANPKVAYSVWGPGRDLRRIKSLQMIATAMVVTDPEEIRRLARLFNLAPGTEFVKTLKTDANLGWLEAHRELAESLPPETVIVKISPVVARWVDNENRPGSGDVIVLDNPDGAR